MVSLEVHAGRLLEVRFGPEVTAAQVAAFRIQLARHLMRQGRKVVICVDLRQGTPFAPEVRAMLLGVMHNDHPSVERAAYLSTPTSAMHALVDEMLGALQHPVRRHCDTVGEAVHWLEGDLEPQERARLVAFLG